MINGRGCKRLFDDSLIKGRCMSSTGSNFMGKAGGGGFECLLRKLAWRFHR